MKKMISVEKHKTTVSMHRYYGVSLASNSIKLQSVANGIRCSVGSEVNSDTLY